MKRKKVVLLGAGRVGVAIAHDLSSDEHVLLTVVDRDERRLVQLREELGVGTEAADASNPQELQRLVRDADLVVGALPGFLGYSVLKTLIQLRKNVVDISFFPEDPADLDQLARQADVTAVIDCGVAPGTSNLIVGWAVSQLDSVDVVSILVGGLPVERVLPWEYKAPFSPVDVIEEYTRPARLVENGHVVVKEPLSDLELLEFDGIGTLEAFNTDGLRTLLTTIPAKRMREKTLRYPGHASKIQFLKNLGLFSSQTVDTDSGKVVPRDLAAALLSERWRYREGEADITVMRIEVSGKRGEQGVRFRYDLLDRYDPVQGLSSMARTTGFMATAVARQVLVGRIQRKGVFAPEGLGTDAALFHTILQELAERGVVYREAVPPQEGVS